MSAGLNFRLALFLMAKVLTGKNISVRDFVFESFLVLAAALAGYAVVFFALSAWRLSAADER